MNYNLIGLAPNISRAYEISKLGNHLMAIVPAEHPEGLNTFEKDIPLICQFFDVVNESKESADIIVEYCTDPDSIMAVAVGRKFETLEDVNDRIEQAKGNPDPELSFPTSMRSLLNSAVNRLNLSFRQTRSICEVSKTIAKLDGSDTVKVQHLAEAIQYQSI